MVVKSLWEDRGAADLGGRGAFDLFSDLAVTLPWHKDDAASADGRVRGPADNWEMICAHSPVFRSIMEEMLLSYRIIAASLQFFDAGTVTEFSCLLAHVQITNSGRTNDGMSE